MKKQVKKDVEGQNPLLSNYSGLAQEHNKIPRDLYEKYSVKRGLRNPDGTGVVVGLTEVGEVHGYIMEEGDKIPHPGRLRYRGYDLYDLVEGFQKEDRFGFEETCFLLLLGKLPTKSELDDFNYYLGQHRELPDGFIEDMILKAPSDDIMNKLARSVLACYTFDDDPDNLDISNIVKQSMTLIAQLPVMAAYAYQAKNHYYDRQSLHIHAPEPGFSTAENILRLLRPNKKFTKLEAEILDLSLVIHAEHGGGNNSAFTMHVVSSSGTDTYSSVSSAIGSLKGPLHGGANIKVRQMMEDAMNTIQNWDNAEEVEKYIRSLLNKEAFDKSGLVYGMGHAIYTISDPRAVLLKKKARSLAIEKGREKEFHLYHLIETLTPKIFQDFKKTDRVMCANVDLYSGFVYNMLSIPWEMFTPIFAIARISGWCAHRIEEIVSGGKIIRPAYKAVAKKHLYSDIFERT
ncbi:citrate/2-methylcitrate synthase [Thiospirochaeta perfilievii]|uniref:citrate synthase (unknown stereospecificity) n=1 Tax=Thiospirochaeta perfilievii TaxID=252967 RepID=A0A5C1QG49_9SPIO|nr:citrate/2-methylcitrate synthase [Thiospirochaeta perfilievii]QEN06049.1 citrate/2-methylcitrate synthase [Thiospirochaeta perfilievii]